jgi:hypothetical protein
MLSVWPSTVTKGESPLRELTKEAIDKAFEQAQSEQDYTVALYRLAYPEWDSIRCLEEYPQVSKTTGLYIMGKASAWNKQHGLPRVGLWFNAGFGTFKNEGVPDWTVTTPPATMRQDKGESQIDNETCQYRDVLEEQANANLLREE